MHLILPDFAQLRLETEVREAFEFVESLDEVGFEVHAVPILETFVVF